MATTLDWNQVRDIINAVAQGAIVNAPARLGQEEHPFRHDPDLGSAPQAQVTKDRTETPAPAESDAIKRMGDRLAQLERTVASLTKTQP